MTEYLFEGGADAVLLHVIDERKDFPLRIICFNGMLESFLRCRQSRELSVWHEEADSLVSVACEDRPRMVGSGIPVGVNMGELDSGIRIPADDAREVFILKPLLDAQRALIEDPHVNAAALGEFVELAGWVFEVENTRAEKLKLVSTTMKKLSDFVHLDQHPRREFV